MQYPERLPIQPLDRPFAGPRTVTVPGSKSITNRALVLAALSKNRTLLHGVLHSEDTEVMIDCLTKLGFQVTGSDPIEVRSASGQRIPATRADLFVANSGTTMRFVTAMAALGKGVYRLDGIPRMRERPIQDLLDALNQLGVKAASEMGNGCPPVVIEADGLSGGSVRIKGNVSSQFLSGLLMAAPFSDGDVRIGVEGTMVSEPYVDMTIRMMEQWGLRTRRTEAGYEVPGRQSCDPRLTSYAVEPDASAASYFFAAAALLGTRVKVRGLSSTGLQGDVHFVDVLERMGCTVRREADGIEVEGHRLAGVDVDMNHISDTVMTLGAVACFADGPTTIRNVGHIRHKETDRIAALAWELRRVGAFVEESDDGLCIQPGPLRGAEIDTYNDHRMAMSLALVGLRVPGIVINNPGCVAKTYPRFFEDLDRLRN